MRKGGPFTSWDDEELILAYQRDPRGADGGRAAAALVERWRGRVLAWSLRTLRDPEAALDVAQTALLQMYEALPRYESRGRFSAWLYTIVQNACRRTFRRASLVRDPEIDPDELFAAEPSAEDGYFSREEERRVIDAMERALDPTERAALWLRANDGLSVDEITALLRLDAASGARALLQTARRKLRAALTAGASRRRPS